MFGIPINSQPPTLSPAQMAEMAAQNVAYWQQRKALADDAVAKVAAAAEAEAAAVKAREKAAKIEAEVKQARLVQQQVYIINAITEPHVNSRKLVVISGFLGVERSREDGDLELLHKIGTVLPTSDSKSLDVVATALTGPATQNQRKK